MILITSGTGKLGSRLAPKLWDEGQSVRIGSRSGEPAFDWERPETWGPCLKDVHSVVLVFHPDLAAPGAPATVGRFVQQAVASGVRRVVLLSGRGEPEAEAAEAEVQQRAPEWTILRASWFAQNFGEGMLRDAILDRQLVLPVGEVLEPFIDVEDVADVAVEALRSDALNGAILELTGPAPLSFAQACGLIGTALGEEVRFESVTIDAFCGELQTANLPTETIDLLRYLFSVVLDGRNSQPTRDVERILGRPAKEIDGYFRTCAESGAWA